MVLSAAMLVFIKVTGFYSYYQGYFFVPLLVMPLIGLIFHALKKNTLMDVALKSDKQLHLKEKLSTSLEWIEEKKERSPMFRALLRDTAKTVEQIKPSGVFIFEWKRPAKRLAFTGAILAVLIWMPSFNLFASGQNPEEVRQIHQEAKKIETLAKKIESKTPRTPVTLKNLKRAQEVLKQLSKELKSSKINKRDALSKIAKAKDSFADDQARKEELEKMEQQLRKAFSSEKSGKEEKEQSGHDQLSQKLQELAKKLEKGNLSDKEKQEIAKDIAKIKQEMEKAGINSDKIEKALEDLKEGKTDKAANSLKQESDQFQERQREMEDLKEMAEDAANQLEQSKDAIIDGDTGKQIPDSQTRGHEFKEGKGDFEGDFGKGTTNKEKKDGDGKASNKYAKRLSTDKPDLQASFEKMYDARRDEFKTATGKVSGKIGKGPTIRSLRSWQKGAPRSGDKAFVNPGDTYTRYKAAGEEAVKRENIPGQYKDLIRDYYDNINPGEK
jgi:myosin heavy subunit